MIDSIFWLVLFLCIIHSVLNEDPDLIDESRGEEVTECQAELWVEKYMPRHFTELLSDDVSQQYCYHG